MHLRDGLQTRVSVRQRYDHLVDSGAIERDPAQERIADRLDRLLTGPVLQYLGRTSYSLYLVHTPIGMPICYFGRRVFGSSPVGGVITFLVAMAVVLVVTHLMFVLVEKPSVRWSQRLKTTVDRTNG